MTDERSIRMAIEMEDAEKLLEYLRSKDDDHARITLEIDRDRAIEEIEGQFPELITR